MHDNARSTLDQDQRAGGGFPLLCSIHDQREDSVKIELFVSPTFAPCEEASRIWAAAACEREASFVIVDINTPDGQAHAQRLGIRAVPLVVVNGAPMALGVQSLVEARQLLKQAED